MTKQTARKWTFKGTSASLAVVMAFGMTPAAATVAMAEEGQPETIVAASGVEGAGVSADGETVDAGMSSDVGADSTVAAANTAEEILSAAVAYKYENDAAYTYTASASVVDGGSLVGYYDSLNLSDQTTADVFKPVMNDMARYLGALYRGGGVTEIAYGENVYEWKESADLAGSNWVIKGTSDQEIAEAIENEKLSKYTLVGNITTDFKESLEKDQSEAAETQSLTESPVLNLKLTKGEDAFDVSMKVEIGSAGDAISAAANAGAVVTLNENATVGKAVEITKGLTIDGNGHTITGQAEDASVFFNVTGGTFAISDATLTGFGNAADTVAGAGVIKVPATASADTKVVSTDVDFASFNRSAFDIQAGSFAITGGTIDCASQTEGTLTKGLKIGGSDQKTTGVVSGTSIENSVSNYKEWDTAAIEVYNNADVDVVDVKTENVKHGVHVDNYWYDANGNVTVDISGNCDIQGEENAVRVYGKADAQSSAVANILGGTFTGDLKAIDSPASSISVTGGTFSVDPGAFVASGYKAVEAEGGLWTIVDDPSAGEGGSGGSGGSGGGGSVTPPEDGDTVTNDDGSTTTTVTEEDGSTTATTEAADGSASTVVKKDPEGAVTSIEATVAGDAAPESTIALPMEPVAAAAASEEAVSISVKAPEGTKVSVPVAKAEGAQGIPSGCVLVMVDAEGNEIPMPKTGITESGLSLEIPGDCILKVVESTADFPDMAGDEWFAEKGVADFVSSRGIMTGVEVEPGSFEFQGDEATNRGMFVTMLHRLELEPSADGSEGFSDVDAASWYSGSSAWAVETGVTTGYIADDGSATFEGDGEVTREQMATFLYRYANWLGLDTTARADISGVEGVSSWAEDALSWAVAEGLVQGDDDTGAIRPGDGATRAEAAVVVMRMVDLFYK